MILDEAIIHCEIVAKSNEKLAEFYYKDPGKNQKSGDACQECAAEHRQLAEWLRDYKRLKEREPCEDAISRQAVLDIVDSYSESQSNVEDVTQDIMSDIMALSSVKQESKTGHCKGCKYFEYDSVAKVDGIPLIVAHEICSKWGDGCKTKEDGYCFLFEPQEGAIRNEANSN